MQQGSAIGGDCVRPMQWPTQIYALAVLSRARA
jgi:hypothetical protein